MSRKYRVSILVILVTITLSVSYFYLRKSNIPILEPAGPVGSKERNLIILASFLSLIVVIPVYVMMIGFAIRYREGNKKAKYQPNFDHSRVIESVWWGVPLVIISILAVVTWNSSKDLDPFKALPSQSKPLTVQVVALQWKWLFIYPEQRVASVNFLELPTNRPISFKITADAPMNSFWIPQLGGQIYAMSGMSTQLHLMANKNGDYRGSSANISGKGFADMNFITRAAPEGDFQQWITSIKFSNNKLDQTSYAKLANPANNGQPSLYSNVQDYLYDYIVAKFDHPRNYPGSPS